MTGRLTISLVFLGGGVITSIVLAILGFIRLWFSPYVLGGSTSSPIKSKKQVYARQLILSIAAIPLFCFLLWSVYVLSYGPAWSIGLRRGYFPIVIEHKFRSVPYNIRARYIVFWTKHVDPAIAPSVALMK
jgi:hypothetical protein